MSLRVQVSLLFIASACAAVGQQSGDVPPPLVWDKLKGRCPASLDWTSLRGSVVVVSFGIDDVFPDDVADWAEIQQQFREKPAVFLHIVTGSEFSP